MHALIIAHGEPVSASLLQSLASEADLVLAADGGLMNAIEAGLTVDAVVGDLDSLLPQHRAALPADALHEDVNPDATDLEKTLQFALSGGADHIVITCAGGGRADHALANLSVLTRYRDAAARLVIIDDEFEITRVEGTATIESPPGTVVSLIAIGDCEGVTTTNLRWDLHDATLPFSPRGVHNEVAIPPATVTLKSGDLLLFRGRWIEPHK